MKDKMTPSARKEWNVALNILGLALIITYGADFASRISTIKFIPERCALAVADTGTFVFSGAAFVVALITAFASTRRQRTELPWLHRNLWLYGVGLAFTVTYIFVLVATSPFLAQLSPIKLYRENAIHSTETP